MPELIYTADGVRVRLRSETAQSGAPLVPAAPVPIGVGTRLDNESGTVVAPIAGICHLISETGGVPYVNVGDRVTAGQTVCVVEVMKFIVSVTAPCDGTVLELLVANGSEVDHGAPLMRIC
jgi:acetyl-CoA carboxylase biotin carboxyl carrier protein